ncbi:MAG: hypothetical protein VYC42_05330 [Pseudomonadota bacterium]|nr:hypothetical protein [Pseudomonadota bacterium]
MLAFLAVFAVGGAVVWVEREFPDFFSTLGGFALIFIASGFIGQIAEGVGLVSGWGTIAVTAAAFLAIVFGLPNLFSRGRWK